MIKYQEIRLAAVGRYLRKLREERKVTQWALARACGFTTAQFVSNWERGIAYPADDCLELLAGELGVDYADLVRRIYAARQKEVAERRDQLLSLKRKAG